jgi:hypothetical protein
MAFSRFKQLTLANAQSGSADSPNWPLCIGLGYGPQSADPDLKDTNNSGAIRPDGFDIYFYSDAALTTRLAAERVNYDGVNGKLEAYVKIPTLKGTGTGTDTIIYMAYGDASIGSDPNSDGAYGTTSTWDSNFIGVYHLSDPTNPVDSTGLHNGTNSGSTAGTGQIDGGASFDGVNNHINATYASNLSGSFTFSAWAKVSAFAAFPNYQEVAVSEVASYSNYYISFGTGGTAGVPTWTIAMYDNSHNPFAFETGTPGVFQYLVGVRDSVGVTLQMFVDGVSANGTVSDTTTSTPSYSDFNIGRKQNGSTHYPLAGSIDEVRISKSVRSQSWITADYNAQKASSTFITWGAQQSALHTLAALGVGN